MFKTIIILTGTRASGKSTIAKRIEILLVTLFYCRVIYFDRIGNDKTDNQ